MSKGLNSRQELLQKRNEAIREAFAKRYTQQSRPRFHSREYVVAQLAEEYYLSTDRVADILSHKA